MELMKIVLDETVSYIERKIKQKPEIGVILGSGLGVIASEIEEQVIVPFNEIPHFPVSTVPGHEGRFVFGELEGKPVMCMQGRFHYYEGYELEQVTLPVKLMKRLGAATLIVTNAAGGINESFEPGDLMVIEDHINLMGVNPLRGRNDESVGPRFPDMSEAYDLQLRKTAFSAARQLDIEVRKGVYAAVSGPSYETPAEIRYLRTLGADAVGMSTVQEVIIANHADMMVLGISCFFIIYTNIALTS